MPQNDVSDTPFIKKDTKKDAPRRPAEAGAFILDWDGVLADTQLDFKPLRQKYFGDKRTSPSGNFPVPLLEAASTLSEPLRGEVMAEIRRVEIEGAERATAVEGAKDLIAWLDEPVRGERLSGKSVPGQTGRRPWAVVSRNCRESITRAAERCGIRLPSVLLSREEPYVKPDPRALALAAERLGVRLSDCVMVGDFVYDLQAAQSAGIPSVLVRSTGAEWESLADFTYAAVTDFVKALRSYPAL